MSRLSRKRFARSVVYGSAYSQLGMNLVDVCKILNESYDFRRELEADWGFASYWDEDLTLNYNTGKIPYRHVQGARLQRAEKFYSWIMALKGIDHLQQQEDGTYLPKYYNEYAGLPEATTLKHMLADKLDVNRGVFDRTIISRTYEDILQDTALRYNVLIIPENTNLVYGRAKGKVATVLYIDPKFRPKSDALKQ